MFPLPHFKDEELKTEGLEKSFALHTHLIQRLPFRKKENMVLVKDENPFNVSTHIFLHITHVLLNINLIKIIKYIHILNPKGINTILCYMLYITHYVFI